MLLDPTREHCGTLLDRLCWSVDQWQFAGCPAAKPLAGETDILASAALKRAFNADTCAIQAAECVKEEYQTTGRACKCCMLLAENPRFGKAIALWAYRLDLVTLASLLCFGSEKEITLQQEIILARDYVVEKMASKKEMQAVDSQTRGQMKT